MRLMTVTGFIVACLSLLAASSISASSWCSGAAFPWRRADPDRDLFLRRRELLALGLVGEYVGLLLQYARRFPLVVEKERVNFD